jgi:hypothetical protein
VLLRQKSVPSALFIVKRLVRESAEDSHTEIRKQHCDRNIAVLKYGIYFKLYIRNDMSKIRGQIIYLGASSCGPREVF